MTLQSGSTLQRLISRVAEADAPERCELCDVPLPPRHRHMLDLHDGGLRCACQGCSLLFEREAAGRDHYRLVPRRRVQLGGDDVPTGIPVGLAFFTVGPDGAVTVRYPSPIGITSGTAEPDTWTGLVERWPELSGLAADVEALLVNTARDRQEYWIVPIDECFRLNALLRKHWTGFSGGSEVWPAIDSFFADLVGPPRPAPTTPAEGRA